jgi:hypothetical protein
MAEQRSPQTLEDQSVWCLDAGLNDVARQRTKLPGPTTTNPQRTPVDETGERFIEVKDSSQPPRPQAVRDLPPHVYRHRGRKGVFAQININGYYQYIGYFSDVEEAAQAVKRAKREASR